MLMLILIILLLLSKTEVYLPVGTLPAKDNKKLSVTIY